MRPLAQPCDGDRVSISFESTNSLNMCARLYAECGRKVRHEHTPPGFTLWPAVFAVVLERLTVASACRRALPAGSEP
jgi:hypothetical protein